MGAFTELVKLLSEDVDLFDHKGRFLDSLEVPETTVDPWVKLYEMGHCRAYDLIRAMLSEWIRIKKDSATVAELRRILREQDFKMTSDNLKFFEEMHPGAIKIQQVESLTNPLGVVPQRNPTPMEIPKCRKITFGLKSVVQNFTGREEELGRLNEYLNSGESPIVLVSGLGGIGKTELAKKFISNISDPSGNGQIVKCWLSGENPQSLLNSTSQFCDQLQLPSKGADGQPLPIQEMIMNIMAKLKSSEEFGRWVVIIDNVDDIYTEFETALETLSEFSPDAFLLVTSRRIDIFPGELELLEVAKMQLTDSMGFVRKSLKIADNSSEDAIKSLCLQLDNFPLALSQAAAFIKQQQTVTLKRGAYRIQNYLDELAKNEKLGLDKNRKLGYSTATLAVWNITIDKIKNDYGIEGEIAVDLLDVMAFINPDEISINFLYKLYHRFYNMEETLFNQIKDSLTLLQNYSLIASYNEVLNIHRLVQLALRDRMSKSPEEDNQPSKYVEMLSKFWTSFRKEEVWNPIEMRNVLTIWNHASQPEELNKHRTFKILNVYKQLYSLGMVNESYEFALEGCKLLLKLKGFEDEEYWLMEYYTASALMAKGEYEPALKKFTAVYWKFKELRNANGVWTLRAGQKIANCNFELERFQYALEWGKKVLQSRIKIHGENNKEVMDTKNLVALTLKKLGKGTEAVEIFYEILEWDEEKFGANHKSILATRHNIAACFYSVEMFAEALEIFQEIFPLQEKKIGADHPTTLVAKSSLADTLFNMGENDQALKLWEEVLVVREKVLGVENPDTVITRKRVEFFRSRMTRGVLRP